MTIADNESNPTKLFQKFIDIQKGILNYLHNTLTQRIAQKIIEEGFEFESHLDNTADLITVSDPIVLNYFQVMRGEYGRYTIVIQISEEIFNKYSDKLKKTQHHFSEALTKKEPIIANGEEPIYTLSEQYIKGYFNHHTKKGIYNPKFNPHYDSSIFEENVKKLLDIL